MDGIERAAQKEVERTGSFIEKVEILKDSEEARQVLLLAKSYFSDAKHFLKEGKFVEAFEAAIISWGYVDSGLHFGKFRVPDEFLKNFTVEKK